MPIKTMNETYWRRKLSAFMHDNPDKPTDIAGHKEKALAHALTDQFQDEEFFLNEADFIAAAADRLLFPTGRKHYTQFDGATNPFRHPLDGKCTFNFEHAFAPGYVHEQAQISKPVLEAPDPRSDFFCRWRFWREWAAASDERMGFLPADTRIPDHSIWNHLSITSAIQGCFGESSRENIYERPNLSVLWFTIGPVQPFIAAARSIRDLWSGSYLLSYLSGRACAVIAEELGPDHLLSPSAWGQPIFDLHLREIYRKATAQKSDAPVYLWEEIMDQNDPASRQRFLIPSLPNRIMALIPSNREKEIADQMTTSVKSLLSEIGKSVLQLVGDRTPIDQSKFRLQLDHSLEIQWHALPIQPSPEQFSEEAAVFLPEDVSGSPTGVRQVLKMLDDALGDRLPSYKEQSLRQWQTIYAYSTGCLDAIKALRNFNAWSEASQWTYGKTAAKDSLTGKEEAVLEPFSDEKAATAFGQAVGRNGRLFKKGEILGALTLLKRLWHISWLQDGDHGFRSGDFSMPNTHSLAKSRPYQDDSNAPEGQEDEETYYAVLVIDGDEMGKWLSGAKMPPLRDQLAPKIKSFFEASSICSSFSSEDESKCIRRPLNPSFHLQFSEALGNFSQYAVRPIVEHYSGRLIYAGGDDVLALLPASEALPCAKALRAAFRGQPAELSHILTSFEYGLEGGEWKQIPENCRESVFDSLNRHRGFLRLSSNCAKPVGAPKQSFIVPGPRADISAGIAIGHIKAPLQDLIKAAQAAEKRAKHKYGRAAVAVTLQKRSGEEVHWGSKWEVGGNRIGPFQFLEILLNMGSKISNRFSYKINSLLTTYLAHSGTADGIATRRSPHSDFSQHLVEILTIEFNHCLERDEKLSSEKSDELCQSLRAAFAECIESQLSRVSSSVESADPDRVIGELIDLFNVFAWTNRHFS
ncbi:MAG: type III-B CRISPR-associated protein Cas10/Cmr2 [Puniceicoccaceae bacterium]